MLPPLLLPLNSACARSSRIGSFIIRKEPYAPCPIAHACFAVLDIELCSRFFSPIHGVRGGDLPSSQAEI